MEKENTNSGSVYVTVDGHLKPVHVSMKGTGEKGFLEFMLEDVEKALKETEMPTMGMMYYNVPNMGIIPHLREGTMMIICKGWKRRWTDMESNCIDTWSVGSGVLPVKRYMDPLSRTRIISSGLHRRCGGR